MTRPPIPVPPARLLVQVTESGRPRSFDWALPTTPGAEMTVGRSRSADLTLRDDHVSGRHVQITVTPGDAQTPPGHALIDLGSTNGTTLSGQAFAPHEPQPLKPGDRILLGGSAEMIYQIDPSTAPPPSVATSAPPHGELASELSSQASAPAGTPTVASDQSITLTGEEPPFSEPEPVSTPVATIALTAVVGLGILGVLGYFAWVLLGPTPG